MTKILIIGVVVFLVWMVYAACIVAGQADDREEQMMRERWKDERSDKQKSGD